MGHLATLTVIIFVTGCGIEPQGSKINPAYDIGGKISGPIILAEDGMDFDLELDVSKDVVLLLFATHTCPYCDREVKAINNRLDSLGRLPHNVEIISILLGVSEHLALAWKRRHEIPWKVGVQLRDQDLFSRYFPGRSGVPSQVIQKDGVITYKNSGLLDMSVLERRTGSWE